MKQIMTLILATAISSTAFGQKQPTRMHVENKQAQAKTSQEIVKKQKTVVQEAVSALGDTKNALTYLDENKKKEAQQAIQTAVGKLETVVARNPNLGMAPFDVTVTTDALLNDAESVNKLREQAITALKNNQIQEARAIVANLKSETVITVANIPLATYPGVLKDAARMIDQNNLEGAKTSIASALGTIVLTKTVIPIPLARADYFMDQASKLSQKTNRSPEENKKVTEYINESKSSLRMAEALGYAPKNAFRDTYSRLDEASKKTSKGETGDFLKEARAKIATYFPVGETVEAQEE